MKFYELVLIFLKRSGKNMSHDTFASNSEISPEILVEVVYKVIIMQKCLFWISEKVKIARESWEMR